VPLLVLVLVVLWVVVVGVDVVVVGFELLVVGVPPLALVLLSPELEPQPATIAATSARTTTVPAIR
jgi:hypothetical protein